MGYAIISLGGKQYRVSEGQRLLVDRIAADEGDTLSPRILFVGGDGEPTLSPDGVTVTARVVQHVLGEKIRIGKYRPKNGFRKHTGYRSRLSQIEIESIDRGGGGRRTRGAAAKTEPADAKTESAGSLPSGYEDMTVVEINEAAKGWDADAVEAALAYERSHGKRKGAIAALESAAAAEEEE